MKKSRTIQVYQTEYYKLKSGTTHTYIIVDFINVHSLESLKSEVTYMYMQNHRGINDVNDVNLI